jgi:hypothetical protein
MSRSHRSPPGYSRGSSPRVDRSLAVTEASFQNLGLSETAGAQQLAVPSSYQSSDRSRRRPSNIRGDLSPSYLQPEYDPDYHRTASPVPFAEDLHQPSTFGTPLLDPADYQLFPGTADYSGRESPFATNISR